MRRVQAMAVALAKRENNAVAPGRRQFDNPSSVPAKQGKFLAAKKTEDPFESSASYPLLFYSSGRRPTLSGRSRRSGEPPGNFIVTQVTVQDEISSRFHRID